MFETPVETGVPLLTAVMVGTIIQSMLFGIFLVLCIKSISVLRSRGDDITGNWTHLATILVTFFQLGLISAHFGLNTSRLVDAFLHTDNPFLYYATVSMPSYVAYTALYIVQGIITDTFMCYRTFVIWQRNYWICILPLLSVVALVVCGTGILVTFASFPTGQSVFKSASQPYIVASLGASLFTNVYCSGTITWRIWSSERRLARLNLSRVGRSPLTQTMHIIVDSALCFTAVTTAAFVSYICQSNIHFLFVDMATPIIGISFCLILVRVGGNVQTAQNGMSAAEERRSNSKNTSSRNQRSYPLAPMHVHITREVHDDGSLSNDDIKITGEAV